MDWKFSKRGHDGGPNEWSGFLDKSVRLEGTLEFSGTFRVEAQVKGTIISSQTLMIGENANMEGEIQGNHVVISGRFNGVIFAKGRVEIHAKGIVTGEIHSPCLVIEPGGIFDGQCHMTAASDAAKTLIIPIRSAQQS
jgi:cytoskeletal protein CcmA (bactofilin family)